MTLIYALSWESDLGRELQVFSSTEARDAYQNELGPRRFGKPYTLDTLTLDPVLEPADPPLPLIPRSKYLFRREPPKFATFPTLGDGWFVYGMDHDLELGHPVAIIKHRDQEETWVIPTEIVAARTVQHRPDSYQGPGVTRFVVARFEDIVTVQENH